MVRTVVQAAAWFAPAVVVVAPSVPAFTLSPPGPLSLQAPEGALVQAEGGLSVELTVDVNRATQADLESVPGIGPTLSTRLLNERVQGPFADWIDLLRRVKGIGWHGAQRLSRGGLRVDGQPHPDDRRPLEGGRGTRP